ncbi:MAG: hypothetical protein SNG49_09275 [Rikenellaceae bacterium]
MDGKCEHKYFVRLILIFIAILALMIYWKSLFLADLLDTDATVRCVYAELGVTDGNAYIDDSGVIILTAEEYADLADLFSEYSYHRTFQTPFSDGSLGELGDGILQVYVYQEDQLLNSLIISSMNKISVNEKVYGLSNAVELIEEVNQILQG